MNLIEIFSILIIHWFADFVLQTDWQAKNKSSNNKALLSHTYEYSLVWFTIGTFCSIVINIFIGGDFFSQWALVWKFAIITFIFHTITDYFTSRLNSKLWSKQKVHNFFVSIGFDQVLHYVQLFLTYWILFK